jgi:CheY-like chemotaxis protein
MPQMNGIEAAINIRKLLPKCRVLLVSGDNESGALLEEALCRGYKVEILATPVRILLYFSKRFAQSEPHSPLKSRR